MNRRHASALQGAILLLGTVIAAVICGAARGQVATDIPAVVPGAKAATVEHIHVHGKSLEGNLEGDAVDREVLVFLPPSYAASKTRRYPVVYALHGYSIGAEQWSHEIRVPRRSRAPSPWAPRR